MSALGLSVERRAYAGGGPAVATGGDPSFCGGLWLGLRDAQGPVERDAQGQVGWGELVARPGFSAPLQRLVDELDAWLRGGLDRLEDALETPSSPLIKLERLVGEAKLPGPARFAVEVAALDLLARRQGLSLAALLAGPREAAKAVVVNAVASSPSEAAARVGEGYRTVKLKCRGSSWQQALSLAVETREAVGEGVALRLDANRAYSVEQAERLLRALQPLSLQYVEEPAAAESLGDWDRLGACGVPLALDESMLQPELARVLVAGRLVTACVIKPAFAGGLLGARRLCRDLAEAGVAVTLTGALESAVGVGAVAHLAAACRPSTASGLTVGTGDPGWLAPRDGTIDVPVGSGLQVTPPPKEQRGDQRGGQR